MHFPPNTAPFPLVCRSHGAFLAQDHLHGLQQELDVQTQVILHKIVQLLVIPHLQQILGRDLGIAPAQTDQVLEAEGAREARILAAEAEAEAILKVQEATAEGIRRINAADPGEAFLKIRALEAFAAAANGRATKIIIPSEIQSLAGLAEGIVETVRVPQKAPEKKD